MFVGAYCMCACLLAVHWGFSACICAHAVLFFDGLKIFWPAHQTALCICLVEAEVQFKAPNLQMCEKEHGFYILYRDNADTPFSCAYLASLILSLSNLVLADEAYT